MKRTIFINLLSFSLFISFISPLNADVTYVSKSFNHSEVLEMTPVDPTQIKNMDPQKNTFWYRDSIKRLLDEQHFMRFTQLLAVGQTPFQSFAVVNSNAHGKLLYIDGEIQSAQADEYIYHESLIHPAMIAHPNPKKVLIIGAGEGAAAREVLRHPSVEQLILIDIDGEIIQNVKELLPEWHQGSFTHPKSKLLIVDGKKYVEDTKEKFDVVVIDICDKLDDSPATALYSEDFYSSVKKILNPNGIVVIQAMEFDIWDNEDHLFIHRTLKKVFPTVASYTAYVPSFWSTWGFVIARDGDSFNLAPETIDQVLQERSLNKKLKHYDGITHLHMFATPKKFREML